MGDQMTGTKGHSGGPGRGGGRKPKPGKQYHITIRCDEAQYYAIITHTTPEQRAEWLVYIAALDGHHNCKCVAVPA